MWEPDGGSTSSWTMGGPSGLRGSQSHIFTHEIHVLLVDHDQQSLASMARMLELYMYKVTAAQSGSAALSLLADGKDQFDLVLTDINLPDIDAFMLLQESVNRELLTILMSANENIMMAKLALENGACFFLEKPVGSNVLKSLWQYVIKERLFKVKICGNKDKLHLHETTLGQNGTEIAEFSKENNSREKNEIDSNSEKINKEGGAKKKPRNIGKGTNIVDHHEVVELEKGDRKSAKKFCTEWTDDLHAKFMAAVNHLGEGRCYPKEILELMNVPGLTRMQVASHLQKCRNHNWRAPETRKGNTSSGQNNGLHYKFGSRKFGSMPRLAKKSSGYPPTSNLQENWGNQTGPQMFSSQGTTFLGNKEGNCVGGNILTHNPSVQSNVGQLGVNGSNNVIYNGDYLIATSNDRLANENLTSLLETTPNVQNPQPVLSYFGNAAFGVDSHSSASTNQAPAHDDFFDFLPEIEGSQGFAKHVAGSSMMNYGVFDVEPIFFDQHEGRFT